MAKKLGQHFLINKSKIKKIIDALELKPGDTVIEIGPGHGELTLPLARNFQFLISNFQIITIEKDLKLIKDLKSKIQNLGLKNIEIIEGDALKILPKLCSKLHASSFKIVGNIPYYITGHLLRIISELKNKPSLIVLTIQKEVAERICAIQPKMNLLAASVQFWAEPKIIGGIPKKDFKPTPKVDSAIIKLVPKSQKLKTKSYYRLIKILFKQPRKTIINNLRPTTNDLRLLTQKLQKLKINPADRPQNLSIKQIKELSTLF
ncbi:MAG: 16S rRNA (adenine(1518)-N(6)/adenine(1519)-N(6))-dimethyltransferase RsmA [Candidatus Paceibacterota bacterium]